MCTAGQEEPVVLDEGRLPPGEHLLQGDHAHDLERGQEDLLGLGRRARLPAQGSQLLHRDRHLQGADRGGRTGLDRVAKQDFDLNIESRAGLDTPSLFTLYTGHWS